MSGDGDTHATHFTAYASGNARVYQAAGDIFVDRLQIIVTGPQPDPGAALAELVRRVWEPEDPARALHNPQLIPVAWETLSNPYSDHWSNIRQDSADDPLRMDGEISGLAGLIGDPRHRGRVVILGAAGSGKTAAALRLTLDLLRRRDPGDPVPLLLRLSTWNPVTQPLTEWVQQRLALDYGLPVAGRRGGAKASADPAEPRVRLQLILDGLDEMPDAGWRRKAIEGINRTLGKQTPLVVTSRTDDYREAVAGDDGRPLTAALAIRLRPLTPEQVTRFLVLAAPPRHSEEWRELLRHDQRRCGGVLTRALDAPLWISLAREVGDRRPDALRDLAETAVDAEEIRTRLLDMLVPAVYPEPAEEGPDGHTWRRQPAREWLTFLARDLVARERHDIAWWQFADLIPEEVRRRLAGAVVGLPLGMLVAAIGWRWIAGPLSLLMIPLFVGAGAFSTEGDVPAPKPARRRLRPRLRHHGVAPSAGFVLVALMLGSGVGCIIGGGMYSVMRSGGIELTALPSGTGTAVAVGSVIATAAFLVIFLTTLFDQDADPRVPMDTTRMVAGDRSRSLVAAAAVWLVATLGMLLATGWVAALALGATAGLCYLLLARAWGWYQVARIWLAVAGRLPWRLVPFLEDACRRGVLRRSGGVYQFRHTALRDRLARGVTPRTALGPLRIDTRQIRLAGGLAAALIVVGCCGGLVLPKLPNVIDRYGTPTETGDVARTAPGGAGVDVSPGTARPGDTVQIHGFGFAPGEQVYVFLTPNTIGATSSADLVANTGLKGEFRVTTTVPRTATEVNEYKVTAVGSVTSRTAQAILLTTGE